MEQVFTAEFWSKAIEKTQEWMITELPGIVIIILLTFITISILTFSLNKLKKTLIRRAGKDVNKDQNETAKRLETLFGILT